MSDETISGSSAEGLSQETRKGRRLGVLLCAASAIATLTAVMLIAGRLFFASEDGMRAEDTEELREIAPAAGATPKN